MSSVTKWQILILSMMLVGGWFVYTSLLGEKKMAAEVGTVTDDSALHFKSTQISNTNIINTGGNNVVSMSLYGNPNPRYNTGIIRNAELIKINFPGWTLRLYVEKVSDKPKYGKVPQDLLNKLKNMGVDIRYMDPYEVKVPPMMWRFLVADDLTVDRFISRDCDSRLTTRDAATVVEWIKSKKAFHCVRDHPSHSGYSVSGGLWGGIPSQLKKIFEAEFKEMMIGYTTAYIQDMHFLGRVIWPRVKEKYAYCSDSYSCEKFPSSHPFPVKRIGEEHVGEVYDGNDRGRPGDMKIIRNTPINKRCSPS